MAASPAPLPTPQVSQVQTQSPLATSLQAISNAVPQIDPEVAVGIAQGSPTPDAALQAAQATQAFQNAQQLKQGIEQENSTNQMAAYNGLDATTQQALKSVGYKPPSPHRSLWGSITSDVGGAFHTTLQALGAPLRAEQHVERTLFAVANQTPNSGSTGSWTDLFHALHTPSDWAQAWEKTSNGQAYILPQVQRQVQKNYDPTTYQAALAIAEGKNTQDIIQNAPAAQQQQMAQLFMSANVQKAAKELMAGHVSTGRMLARALGLNPGPGNSASSPGAVVSGVTDAVTAWFGDPVNIGLKGVQAYSAAKYFVQNGEHVQQLYKTNKGVQAAFDDMAAKLQEIKLSGAMAKARAAGMTDLLQGLPPADTGALGTFMSRYGVLAPALDEMLKANLTSGQDVADFFDDWKNVGSLINGRPASLPGRLQGGLVPHLNTGVLSRVGLDRASIKEKLMEKVDFLADTPWRLTDLQPGDVIDSPLNPQGAVQRIQTGTGLFLRHLLTLTPTSTNFNPYAENWFNKLSDVTSMSLPRARANQLLTDYANAATIGERKLVFKGILKEVYDSVGANMDPVTRQWADDMSDEFNEEAPISHASYSANGMDLLPDKNGNLIPQGLARGQMSDNWPLPTYKTLYAQTKKLGVIKASNGALNNKMVDTFMNQMWKPLALARFGFSVRVAGEEAFGLILRNGAVDALKARAAASAAKRGTAATGSFDSPAASLFDNLTAHLPTSVKNKIQTPTDLATHYLADAWNRGMAGVEGKLAGSKYLRAAELSVKHNVNAPDGTFGRFVSAGERHSGNFYDSTMSTGKPSTTMWDHGKLVPARLKATGAYKGYEATATQYTQSWYKRLREIANDPWLRPALTNRDLPYNERVDQIANVLKGDKNWSLAARSAIMRDGRQAGIDATVNDLARDHAAAIIDHVDYHTQSANQQPIEGLAQHLIDNRRPPTQAALDKIPADQRPSSVSGPELVPVLGSGTSAWTRGVNAMFRVIGKQIDWISRTPMFGDNFAKSLDAYQQSGHLAMWKKMVGDEQAEKLWVDAAQDRALHQTLPYIHHPELRSQMSVITRNVVPFWFAQEQFFKRWGRTMIFAPQAFRKAQLINQGVAHSGFTHTDPSTGQQYFIYPGAGAVQDVLTHALGAFGYSSYLPIEANLRGQVKMASPGLERLGLPNLGPVVVVPMKVVTALFPELRPPAQSVEGPISSQAGFLTTLVPTTVARVWQDFTATPNNSPQYASAMMQAIQYLEASGHGIGTIATTSLGDWKGNGGPTVHGPQYKPGDYYTNDLNQIWVMQGDGTWRQNSAAAMNTYMTRVKNWTRIFLITRTIFGFNVPASPENQFDPNHVNEDFQTLLKELPTYQEAVNAFMAVHPDATAYTVFQTKDQSGAPLPATTTAMAFMNANSAFFHDYPLAGSFFIPTTDSSGKYSSAAYQSQLQQQLRIRRTPAEFWQEIAYEEAANQYFNAENTKNQMLNSASINRNLIDQDWTQQSQQFFKANPLFAQQLEDTGGAYTRGDIEQQLAAALADPRVPENTQTEDIRTLFTAYLNYQNMVAPYSLPGGNTISGTMKYQIETAFATQAVDYVVAHPDALNVFNRLIRPDLSSVLNSQAQSL